MNDNHGKNLLIVTDFGEGDRNPPNKASSRAKKQPFLFVIAAQAAIYVFSKGLWMPACASMTRWEGFTGQHIGLKNETQLRPPQNPL
jgi:hypothetical protein